jgi:hypothetical protein
VKLVWIDSHDWAVFLVELFHFEEIFSTEDDIVVELIPKFNVVSDLEFLG